MKRVHFCQISQEKQGVSIYVILKQKYFVPDRIYCRSSDDFSFQTSSEGEKCSFSVYLSDECTQTQKTAPYR